MQTSQARQLFGFGGKGAYYAGGSEEPEGERSGKSGGGTSPIPCNQPCGRDDDSLHAQALKSPGLGPPALPRALALQP